MDVACGWLGTVGLELNTAKTEVMLLSRGKQRDAAKPITAYGKPLQRVSKCMYLGIPFYGVCCSEQVPTRAGDEFTEQYTWSTHSISVRLASQAFKISQAQNCLRFRRAGRLSVASRDILGPYSRTHIWERLAFLGWTPLLQLGICERCTFSFVHLASGGTHLRLSGTRLRPRSDAKRTMGEGPA